MKFQKNRIIQFLLLAIIPAALWASPQDEAEEIINSLRDIVFQQDLSDQEIRDVYLRKKEILDGLNLPAPDKYLYTAGIEYWMGRAYQSFDQTRTVIEHHKMVQRGKFLKCQQFYTAPDDAIKHYEVALDNINKYIDENPVSEAYRQYSEIQGQLLLLKPVTYVLANGLSVKRTLKKSLKLDPENVKSLIADGASDIYTPPNYGGDQDKGINLLKTVLEMDGVDKEDRFNIFTGIGYGLIVKEDYPEALEWLDKAEGIYPGNVYLSGLKQIAREGME